MLQCFNNHACCFVVKSTTFNYAGFVLLLLVRLLSDTYNYSESKVIIMGC